MKVVQSLTLGEIAAVENLSGVAIDALADSETPKAKATAALVYVIKRRKDREFQYEDALKLTMEEANEVLGIGVEPDPSE